MYKVGDLVRIKRALGGLPDKDTALWICTAMDRYMGESAKITRVDINEKVIKLDIPRLATFVWHFDWLEPQKKSKLTLKDLL